MIQPLKIVINDKPGPIINLLYDYFRDFESQSYSVFVDVEERYINPSGYYADSGNIFKEYTIYEKYPENPDAIDAREPIFDEGYILASLIIQEYPKCTLMRIEGYIEEVDWKKVENLVQKILEKLREFEFEITSIDPPGLLPNSNEVTSKDEASGKYNEIDFIKSPKEKKRNRSKLNKITKLASNGNGEDWIIDKDPSGKVPNYGTDRDLSKNDVKAIVKRCRDYQHLGGTVRLFYDKELPDPYQNKFTYETLKSWLKNEKFKSVQ